MTAVIPSQRHLFEFDDDVCYLNCAYMSPRLRAAGEAALAGLARQAKPWTIREADFFEPAEEIRGLFAGIINGDAEGVALIPSAAYGLSTAAANVDVLPGQTVVILEEQFPSNVYPWWDVAERTGADLITVPRPLADTWTEAVLAAIDQRAAVVAVPNCHWTDGSVLDLVEVGRAAREVGAALVVDASQSAGVYPTDVGLIRPDFLVTIAYKWLLHPYTSAYLWAAPERRGGRSLEQGWMPRDGSEDFAGLVAYTAALKKGARRYDMGEFSNWIALPMFRAALEQMASWGADDIARTLGELTDRVERGAAELGLEPMPARLRVPHMIGIRMPAGVPAGLPEQLARSSVFVSVRGDSVRVSPHVYNTSEDVDRLLDVLASVA